MIYDFTFNKDGVMVFSIGNKFEKHDILIDEEDKERIINSYISWHVEPKNGMRTIFSYAVSKGKGFYITLPQFILQTTHKDVIIHKNNNPLDCRKENLIVAKSNNK